MSSYRYKLYPIGYPLKAVCFLRQPRNLTVFDRFDRAFARTPESVFDHRVSRRAQPVIVRSRRASVVKAGVVCAILVSALVPTAWLLFSSGDDGLMGRAYSIAALLPLAGALVAMIAFVAVAWRRSRPVLVIDNDMVYIHPSRVEFPITQVSLIAYLPRPDRVVILPHHEAHADFHAAAPYTVVIPPYANYQPFELVDAIRARAPQAATTRG